MSPEPQLFEAALPTAHLGFWRLDTPENAAVCAMDVSVRKDRKTGDTKLLSVSAANPGELGQRSVKVYDHAQRVVYEVRSGGSTSLENGLHPWSLSEAGELMQQVGESFEDRPGVTFTCTSPTVLGTGEQTMPYEANLDVSSGGKGVSVKPGNEHVGWGVESPETSAGKYATMVYAGEGIPEVLTLQEDVVLIDEDDDRSLREKTVTDISAMDGTAADLVAGQPLSVSSELPTEEKEDSPVTEIPPPVIQKKKRCHCRCCTVM